ncbi:MAG: hypothetical protein AAF517_05900 [Planctomycetota bacterium]
MTSRWRRIFLAPIVLRRPRRWQRVGFYVALLWYSYAIEQCYTFVPTGCGYFTLTDFVAHTSLLPSHLFAQLYHGQLRPRRLSELEAYTFVYIAYALNLFAWSFAVYVGWLIRRDVKDRLKSRRLRLRGERTAIRARARGARTSSRGGRR